MTAKKKPAYNFVEMLHFNAQDLEYNRTGIISPRQKKRLMAGAKAFMIIIVILLLLITAGIYAVNDGSLKTGQYYAVAILWVLLLGLTLFFYIKTRKGVKKNEVKCATGKVSFKIIRSKYASQNYLMIEGYNINLACPPGGEKVLSPQKQYHVYYIDSMALPEVLSIQEKNG